jgi:Tol biopolymer transport system component
VLVPNVRGAPGSITPDEAWLVYHGVDATGDINIWSVSLNGGRKPEQFIATPGRDIGPRLSRTGELLAYATQSATTQLFVTSFPEKRENVRVSVDGGNEPVWSPAGSELFYRWRNKMMSVRIRTQPGLGVDSPKELLSGTFETGGWSRRI